MKKFISLVILFALIGAGLYIWKSPTFSRIAPKIVVKTNGYWNLKDKLEIDISDKVGVKFYQVILINNGVSKVLVQKKLSDKNTNIKIDVKLPPFYQIKGDNISLKIVAVDNSKWNYFAGNETTKMINIKIDTTVPMVEVIGNNYAMRRGGSGIAIVRVDDKNLKNAYIKITNTSNSSDFKIFKLTPFYKKSYYISLLAWPYKYQGFSADVVAVDMANNKAQAHIPIRWILPHYPKVKIKISDNFVRSVVVPLLKKMGLKVYNDPVKNFQEINEKLRAMDESELNKVTNVILEKKVNNFNILPLHPLKGASKEASYGEQRSYYYKNQKISFAIHKGIDLASYRHAKIYASNSGKVLKEWFNGIYGNTLALYHSLGFVTTYSHCSMFNVAQGANVQKGMIIAHTGATGAVFGDHLHFGVYIQGIPVWPLEWMDPHWIKNNITGIIIKSKRLIDR